MAARADVDGETIDPVIRVPAMPRASPKARPVNSFAFSGSPIRSLIIDLSRSSHIAHSPSNFADGCIYEIRNLSNFTHTIHIVR